jgi:hypothetical protein
MIIDQLFTPKPLEEGGPYDLPGKDYDRPGDTPRKQSSGKQNPYPYSPEEDDDYFREIFRKKREAAAKDQGVAEAKWNPYDQGDFPTDYNADDPAVGAGVGNAEKWQAMQSYYGSRANIVGALQAQRGLMHPAHGTKHGVQAVMSTSLGKRVVKTFPNKEKAYDYAGVHNYEVVEIKDTGLATNPITLNVVLGHGEHKKQFSLQFPDMGEAQQWADRYHAEILGQSVAEGTGQDSKSWMASIRQQHPDVKFVQAKMLGAPIMAMVNGKPVAQFDTKKGVAEGDNNSTHGMDRYVKPVRPGEINKALQKGIDQRKAARERMQANVANLPTHPKKGMSESKRNKQRRLNEARLMEDPIYRDFKRVGQYIAEQKLTEPEILQIFSNAETGMTDKGTGANRTFLGRGKDTTMDFAGGVADALKGVWSGIQNSVPVAAVDVAYDQATDALANLTGGQKGAVMQAIKKYRNLAKQYPKTAGLSKAALVAIAGLATGGAGLPAVAALVYGLDSAIKGEKFSDIALKAGGAGATAWAGGKLFGGGPQPGTGETDSFAGLVDPTPDLATYTVQPKDNLSTIADRFNTSVAELKGLNPQLAAASGATGGQGMNVDVIFPGQQITLPPGTPGTDVYAGGVGTSADTMADIAKGNVPDSAISQGMAAKGQAAAGGRQFDLPTDAAAQNAAVDTQVAADYAAASPAEKAEIIKTTGMTADQLDKMVQQAGTTPIDYTKPGPESVDSLGQKLEYGMPVNDKGSFIPPNPALPPEELAKQTAAYNSWKTDFMKRFPNATLGADGAMQPFKPGLAPMQILTKPTLPAAVQESIKFKILPASKLIDQKATVLNWALNESVGRRSHSVNLTAVGTYTVFENIDRYRQVLLEYTSTQPGRPELPDQYRPDMSGGAGVPSKPGLIGRGLNALDRGVKKVGGALSNFGHQFTTGVTKEKLKMNWHQAGKPSDSDQLAAWLVTQKVPQEVVSDVFSKMGIPYTATAQPATAQPAAPAGQPDAQTAALAKTGGGQTSLRYGINPANGKPLTATELRDRAAARREPANVPTDTNTSSTTPTTAPATTAAGTFPGEDPQGPGYVGRREVARRQAARDAEAAKKPAAPNFAQQGGGYKNVNYAPNIKTGINLPKTTATAPAGTKVTAGGPTADEKAKLDQRIAQALKQPVAEMLQMVETKEDVQRIKQFVDDTFVRYGAVNESAFAVRNQILEHVTQAGAQRRREHSQRVAT